MRNTPLLAALFLTTLGVAAAPAALIKTSMAHDQLYLCGAGPSPLRHFVLQVDSVTLRAQMLPTRERAEMPAGLHAGSLGLSKTNWIVGMGPKAAFHVLVLNEKRHVCEATYDD